MIYRQWSPQYRVMPSLFLIITAVILVIGLSGVVARFSASTPAVEPLAAVDPGRWRLAFVPNGGQSDGAVQYQAHIPGANLFFTEDGLALSWAGAEDGEAGGLKLSFAGANGAAVVSGREAQVGVVNYMLGDDPDSWQTGLPTYGVVTYEGLYPGVSLAYTGQGRQLSAVFQVEAGADPAQIGWEMEWARPVLSENGRLELVPEGAADAAVTLSAPQAWQVVDGREVAVSAAYWLDENGRVGLALGDFDGGRPLVITTVLSYTPLGNGPSDIIKEITIGPTGRFYVSGTTNATIFPLANPYQSTYSGGIWDVFVTVFAPDGQSLIYSTYLGGDGYEDVYGITVDAFDRAFVTGWTSSYNFPLANPYQPTHGGDSTDAYVTVFTPDGQSLVYSTFLGGNDGDRGYGIAVDANGYAYVAGGTASANFPLVNPLPPSNGGNPGGFVTVFAPDGQSLFYSTYLGGNGNDVATAIALDGNGRAYVSGETNSANFPLVNPYQPTIGGEKDTFVTIFAQNGQSLEYSTFLGGNYSENVSYMSIDGNGRIYITGDTWSSNFPLVNPYQPYHAGGIVDSYVTVFAADGQSLTYSTYLGGSSWDWSFGIAVDEYGQAYVAGQTRSENFPLYNPYQATLDTLEDAFVTVFAPDGQSLNYSTYLGGNGYEAANGIAVDGNGRAYVAGYTSSSDFPLVDPFQSSFSFSTEGFVTILAPDGQSLDYSTYLHGAYPGDPTSVEVSELGQTAEGNSSLFLLGLGLLVLLLVGVLVVKRTR